MPHQWMPSRGHMPMPAQHGRESQTQPIHGLYTCMIKQSHPVPLHKQSHPVPLFFAAELLHAPGSSGNQLRGSGRSHSPGAPQHPPKDPSLEAKIPSPNMAPSPDVPIIKSHDSQVDSWEDIDDSIPSSQPPPIVPDSSSQTLTPAPGATETELKADTQSIASSSGRSTPKSQELPLPSSSASSTPDLAKMERKHPSPNLSDRGSSSSRGEGGGATGKGNKHSQAPPPKDAGEKENINIVFIGHVGMFLRCVAACDSA